MFLCSSKILYNYKLKGNFEDEEFFGDREFKCKLSKSGNLQCMLFKQTATFDIEEERKYVQLYEDEDVIIYEIKKAANSLLSTKAIGNVVYYYVLTKTEEDEGLVLPGLYIILFTKPYAQKFIIAKKNTRASKNKFPKLSKYLHHAQPLKPLVKLILKKEEKLTKGKNKVFLKEMLEFSKYLQIGSIFYAKESVSVNESFSFKRANLPYDSTWFDLTYELENFCCLMYAWMYVHINYFKIPYDEFADYKFLICKDFEIKPIID